MCNWRTRTAGVYRTRSGVPGRSRSPIAHRIASGSIVSRAERHGSEATNHFHPTVHLLPTPFLCHNATIAKTRIISQSSTRRKKKPATNSFQCSARATIHIPLAIRLQSQNQPAIKERKRPEYIEPDRGSGAVRVLPLRPDSEIARHRESRVFHNPTPDTTPFPPRSQPRQYPNTIQSNRGASPRNTNPPSPTKNAIPMQSRCNP